MAADSQNFPAIWYAWVRRVCSGLQVIESKALGGKLSPYDLSNWARLKNGVIVDRQLPSRLPAAERSEDGGESVISNLLA